MEYTVSGLLKEVERSEQYRDRYLKTRALRNIRWYNGEYNNYIPSNNLDFSELNYYVNLVYSTARTIVTSIYSQDPDFSFFLRGDLTKTLREQYGIDMKLQTEKLQRVLEAITKIYFKEMQTKRTNRIAITDMVLMGFGVTKLGYNVDFNDELKKQIKLNYNIPKDKWIEFASNLEESSLIRRNEPYLVRVHPLNMLFPVEAEAFNRISWECEIVYKNRADAEKMYGVKGLPATYTPEYLVTTEKKVSTPDIVKLYEFHSLDPKKPMVYVFCQGYDKFLEKKQHPLYNEESGNIKSMYQKVWVNESYKSIYPLSDIDLVESQIRESTFQTQKRVEHVRKFVKMLFLKGQFEEDEKLKIVSGEDGTYIESLDGNASVEVIESANLSNDFYNNIASIRNEIYETLGITDYESGGNTQNRKATEAQLMERSRIDRVQERVDIIEEWQHTQIDTFVEMMKEYEQVGRMFNIELGDERISMFFAGELLKMSDISTQVVAGSTVSLDRNVEINRMERLTTLLINANMAQPGLVKIGEWLKVNLNKMGYAGDDFIAGQEPMALPPGIANNVPNMPQAQNQPNVATPTPQQLGGQPNMMGAV